VYDLAPLTPPSGSGTSTPSSTSNPISGLAHGTTYQFYVRSVCGGGYYSDWAGPQNFKTLNVHPLNIPQGWSGLSSFVSPQNSAVKAIFQPAIADLIILQSQTAMYWPAQQVNTIENWNSHEGYAIKMMNPAQVDFVGNLEDNLTLQLSAGWNL
jgi:hypothetical protein